MSETDDLLIYQLSQRIAEQETNDAHFKAVLTQLTVANYFYIGLIQMVRDENGLAAEALLRSLFDSAVNCIILAKYKQKLQDFIKSGQFTNLRMLRFNQLMKERFEPLIKATEKEWESLLPEFKNVDWHKLGTRDSFTEAEFRPETYDLFFRRASSFAHGEPFITVRRTDNTWKNWNISPRPEWWKSLTLGAYGEGSIAMLHLLAIVSREFKLGIETELLKHKVMLDELKARQIQLMNQMFENQDKQAGQVVQPGDKKS